MRLPRKTLEMLVVELLRELRKVDPDNLVIPLVEDEMLGQPRNWPSIKARRLAAEDRLGRKMPVASPDCRVPWNWPHEDGATAEQRLARSLRDLADELDAFRISPR